MFDFKETSENFGRALETTVQGLVDEYRPHLKRQTDDSILLARSEMAALVSDSLSQFRRRIVGPAVWLVCFLLMALAGTAGFLLGAAW